MPVVAFIPATSAHVAELAPTLRPEDCAELEAQGLGNPHEGLSYSLLFSDLAWTATFDGKAAAMFGLKKDSERSAQIWFLTGSEFLAHARHFIKPAKKITARLAHEFGRIWVNVDARYSGALRLATHLGFVVDEATYIDGPTGVSFRFAYLEGV